MSIKRGFTVYNEFDNKKCFEDPCTYIQKPPFDKPVSFLRLFDAKTRALLIGAILQVRENAVTTTA